MRTIFVCLVALSILNAAFAYSCSPYIVVAGDTCNSICQKCNLGYYDLACTQALYRSNSQINSDCTNLQIGSYVNVPSAVQTTPAYYNPNYSCSPYTVVAGDTCNSICQKCNLGYYDLACTQALYRSNSQINSDCTNLKVGGYVNVPSAVQTTPAYYNPNYSCSPYTVVAGDTCNSICQKCNLGYYDATCTSMLVGANSKINSACSNLAVGDRLYMPGYVYPTSTYAILTTTPYYYQTTTPYYYPTTTPYYYPTTTPYYYPTTTPYYYPTTTPYYYPTTTPYYYPTTTPYYYPTTTPYYYPTTTYYYPTTTPYYYPTTTPFYTYTTSANIFTTYPATTFNPYTTTANVFTTYPATTFNPYTTTANYFTTYPATTTFSAFTTTVNYFGTTTTRFF